MSSGGAQGGWRVAGLTCGRSDEITGWLCTGFYLAGERLTKSKSGVICNNRAIPVRPGLANRR